MFVKIAVHCDARHVSKSYPRQDICPPVTRFERSRVQRELRATGNRCNRRHCEFISIFNLIRNSFATISQTAPPPPPLRLTDAVPLSLSLILSSSVASLRPVDLSLDLFQQPPTSSLSLVAPASHSFRYISLMELPYRSLSPPLSNPSFNPSILAPAISLQIPRTFYTTYLPLSATVTFVVRSDTRFCEFLALFRTPPPFHPYLFRKILWENEDIGDRNTARGRWLFYDRQSRHLVVYFIALIICLDLDGWSCCSFQTDLKEYLSKKVKADSIALIGLFY